MGSEVEVYRPRNTVRVVTATSLFDGHDASTNIMRRILQDSGVEVIHLAHNRSVLELVDTAIEEDAQAIAMSSYQGGHMEAFTYMIDLLREKDADHIKVFGGGGGVIITEEIRTLEAYGVAKIFSPEDGTTMGLQGMINHMLQLIDFPTLSHHNLELDELSCDRPKTIAGFITGVQQQPTDGISDALMRSLESRGRKNNPPVIGVTGTGGAGKSSLTDEIILRFLHDFKELKIAVVCCDPSRRKTGGALLGDRIRMNSLTTSDRVYMRSLATGKSSGEIAEALPRAITVLKAAGFDLIIAETAGIGQGDSRITDLVDLSVYVMTSEYGAPSQLEKIDMLDYADIIAVNKFEKKGSDDAIRDIRKQVQRNRKQWDTSPEEMPVYGTIASKFNDDGVTALYHGIIDILAEKSRLVLTPALPRPATKTSSSKAIVIPPERIRYLAEIVDTVRDYHQQTQEQATAVRSHDHLRQTIGLLAAKTSNEIDRTLELLEEEENALESTLSKETRELLARWQQIQDDFRKEEYCYTVRGREVRVPLFTTSLSHSRIPKISLPKFQAPGDIYTWLRKENLPGFFPYTAGVFPLKRTAEDPTRMFAGEGGPAQTNRRFKLLSENYPAKRLSTAFDSVTLYGCDPATRPDIYGKVGTSGVSICTLDDVKLLYSGFDLCSPTTSVSMTINGPAPIILAMFMNTAIDQQVDSFAAEHGRQPEQDEYHKIRKTVLANVRGTVQADILKEDQGQNTCIFSIEFALKMMGDIQEYFIEHQVRNFYSVSVSGYHIAEAGANPITQLALTLSNGFTYVEYYLSRGMRVDDFAPNLSFFFSNGMDPEYTVIGRVARRIWAVTMREKYGASARSQQLKYHVQTSGRSLHSQEIQLNDIRTTLQALCAVYDNCNSLHTNAFDEAITTPSDESVRRALAIQLIINREWGLAKNENPYQGSFIVEELTDLVEEAVLKEFERISDRGGVLGAMETGYQRSRIQEESLYYEGLKHSGQYPIIGVNTFRNPDVDYDAQTATLQLARSTEKDKNDQIERLATFHQRHQSEAPAALARLKEVALSGGNIFDELLETVRYCSLGQITAALYEVGGQYRRIM